MCFSKAGVHHGQSHAAAGMTQAPIVLPGSGGQWEPISSLSPPRCLAAWGSEPSRLFQRVKETPQRLCAA